MTLNELYAVQLKDSAFKDEFYKELLNYGRSLLRKWYGAAWTSYEDCIVDISIILLDKTKAQPNGSSLFTTWFYRSLERRCLKFGFEESREHSIEAMPEEMASVYKSHDFRDIIHTVDLRQRLNNLTSRQRDIIELTLAGYNQAEIGVRLDISPRTVSHHYEDAIHKLRVPLSRRAALEDGDRKTDANP